MTSKCGYVCLFGRPNVGKSTLLNALIGDKLSGVSSKPQTTRTSIKGIWTEGEVQIIFVDPPGLPSDPGSNLLKKAIKREAWQQFKETDILCYLIDIVSMEHFQETDLRHLEAIADQLKGKKILLIFTQMDRSKKFLIRPKINQFLDKAKVVLPQLNLQDHYLTISAKRPEDLETLVEHLIPWLPEGPHLFAEDQTSDRSMKTLVAEHIREQIFRQFSKEIPYETTVVIQSYETGPKRVEIAADILVSRDSLKAMIIGKGGLKLKEIGIAARQSLEQFCQAPVHLELYVKVEKDWTRSLKKIIELEGFQDSEET
jgi:GTP-binding protein Era